ncbi:hypothetical protein ACRRTK_000073 [Alexandromys fortis]
MWLLCVLMFRQALFIKIQMKYYCIQFLFCFPETCQSKFLSPLYHWAVGDLFTSSKLESVLGTFRVHPKVTLPLTGKGWDRICID